MSGLEADTIGGFNSLIKKQRKEDGEAIVSMCDAARLRFLPAGKIESMKM